MGRLSLIILISHFDSNVAVRAYLNRTFVDQINNKKTCMCQYTFTKT